MRKIRLDVDALEVTSFAVDDAARAERGTIHGQRANAGQGTDPVDSCDETCWRDTCNPCGAAIAAARPLQPAQPGSYDGGFSCGASCYWICQESDFC